MTQDMQQFPPGSLCGGLPQAETHLIAFRDGSYKEVTPVEWKHSQWIHYTLQDRSVVMINPSNVNYIHRGLGV